jgi:hypothetical protein
MRRVVTLEHRLDYSHCDDIMRICLKRSLGCENTIYEAADNLNHEQGDGYKCPPEGTDGDGKATTTSQDPSSGTKHTERTYSSLRGTIKTSVESPRTVARAVKDNAAAFNS